MMINFPGLVIGIYVLSWVVASSFPEQHPVPFGGVRESRYAHRVHERTHGADTSVTVICVLMYVNLHTH